MSSGSMKRWTLRYMYHKAHQSLDAAASVLSNLDGTGKLAGGSSKSNKYANLPHVIRETLLDTFSAPLTRVIKFTGGAMLPTLNRRRQDDPAAEEFILARKIIDPSAEDVQVGDLVCFKHPLHVRSESLMVRRVMAAGGDFLSSPTQADHQIAPDHVWVLADNQSLQPPDVEDSRTFGPVPLGNIFGRCIYSIQSRVDHGMLTNHELWKNQDKETIAVELTDELLDELDGGKASSPAQKAAEEEKT